MSEEYWIDAETKKELQLQLQESRLYLATDYSLHVKEYSQIPEHRFGFVTIRK